MCGCRGFVVVVRGESDDEEAHRQQNFSAGVRRPGVPMSGWAKGTGDLTDEQIMLRLSELFRGWVVVAMTVKDPRMKTVWPHIAEASSALVEIFSGPPPEDR